MIRPDASLTCHPVLHEPASSAMQSRTAGLQHAYDLPGQALGLGLNALIREFGKRVRHVNDRIFRHPPHRGGRLGGVDEMIRAKRGCWNTGAVEMNAVVHTARATRASIANPDNHQVARLAQRFDHLRGHWLRS